MQTDRSQSLAVTDIFPPASGRIQPRSKAITRDNYFLLVGVVAVVLSVLSFAFFYSQGFTLEYYDAQARLLITRRVVDSPTPGLAQLGGVWLPLTHLLAVPLIGNNFLYHTGIALSVISMLSFVLTALYLYQILIVLTGDRIAGLIAVFILVSNPNMLFMQSTPMTEMPMYLSMVAAVYYLLRLSREPDNRIWYFWSGFTIALSTLIRYEGWMLLIAEIGVLIYIFIRNRFNLHKIEGLMIYWGYWALAGIGAWVLWNWVIFGDPLAFQRGEYAKPSLWVTAGDPVIGHLNTSFFTFWYAMLSTVGPLLFVGIIAVVVYLIVTRLKSDSVVPLTLLSMVPFFVLMLYLGQRPLRVPEISGGMYNVRFALVMLLPVAIFVAYIARFGRWFKILVPLVVVIALALTIRDYGVITLQEPVSGANELTKVENNEVAAWLKDHYDGKPLLIESYGNDQVEFEAGISLKNVIYEGSYRIWDHAMATPEQYVDWAFMRSDLSDGSGTPADKVWRTLRDQTSFHQNFELIYHSAHHEIYRKRARPVQILVI